MRGRKPKPIALRKLEGNPGKRPLGKKPRNDRPKSKVAEISAAEAKGREKNRKKGGETNYTKGAGLKGQKDIPACPFWLKKAAKNEWHRIVPVLARLGLLSTIDRAALAGYCQAYARWSELEKTLEKYGMVYKSKNGIIAYPQVYIAQKYLQICKQFCVEFGMTPSARGRMTFGGGDEKEDEFEKILD